MLKKDRAGSVRKKIKIFAAAGALAVGGGTYAVSQAYMEKGPMREKVHEDSGAEKEHTVLVYMIGSDLESSQDAQEEEVQAEGAATADMMEMSAAMKNAGLDEKVNVVVEIGGSRCWKDKRLAGIQNARLTIDSDGIHVKEKLPDTDMGESKSVTEFINYACDTYPARNYYFVFWNHGNGPADGYGYDVLHNGSSLTLDELHKAIDDSRLKNFRLIGFDACCMGNLETANALHTYAEYMVASPACEDIDGWNYSWMEVLSGESVSGLDVGKTIVDTFADYYADFSAHKNMVTLSCYDMSKYEALSEGIQKFNGELLAGADGETYKHISADRSRVAGYDSGGGLNEEIELLDFEQFFTYLDAGMWQHYEMEKCVDDFICHAVGISDSLCGISIYLPGKKGDQLAEDMYHYMRCGFEENYIKFVFQYAKTLDQDLEINLNGIHKEYDEKSKTIQFQLDRELMDKMCAAYIMTAYPLDDEEGFYLLSTDSDVTIAEDGTATAILDKEYFSIAGQVLSLIEQSHSGICTRYLSPVMYHDRLCMMTIEVSDNEPDGRIVSIVPYDREQKAQKEQYVLEEGAAFCALHPVLSKNSEIILCEKMSDSLFQMEETVVLNDYDCILELKDIQFDACRYGLMIKDEGLNVHYSSLYQLKED